MLSALVDTDSGHTVIKESSAKNMKGEITLDAPTLIWKVSLDPPSEF